MRKILPNLLFFLIFSFVILCSGCKKKDADAAGDQNQEISVPVYTKVVHAVDFDNKLEVIAKVEPVQQVVIASESAGQVLSAPFEENEYLKKGALLLKTDAKNSSSQVSIIKSSISSAKREYERAKKLASEGLAPPQQVDQLKSQLDQAELNLKQAQIGLAKTVLRSPIAGYVVQKLVHQGEFVSPGQPVTKIIDYDTVKIVASVPESEIRHIRQGNDVEVEIPALKKTFIGKVYRRSVMAHQDSRTFDVDIRIDNPEHEILPGMRAKVFIPRDLLKNVVVVDQSAILQGFDNQEAMVLTGVTKVGKAERRIVKTGPTKGAEVVVLEGLREGDRLITKGHRNIIDGSLVEDHTNDIPSSKTTTQKKQPSKGSEQENGGVN